MDGSVVGEESGRFVAIFDELVSKGKVAARSAACAFFTEIRHIAGNMEDHVAGTIVDCGIGLGYRVV